MKQTKLKLLVCCSMVSIANAGLFDNDAAYYQDHPQKMDQKIDECNKAFAHAMIDKDKDKISDLKKDPECNAAHEAKKALRKKEYEARKRQEEKEKADKEALFNTEYDKSLSEFKTMDYQVFIGKEKEVCKSLSFFGDNLSPEAAKCKAWKDLKQVKENEGIETLLDQYPKDKILEYKNKVCEKALYGDPKCDFAIKAFNRETENVVEVYLSNREALKKDFNECQSSIDKLNKSGKYEEARKMQKTYQCEMALKAANKISIFGYFSPMM
ncbi:MAG: hypothetical protein JXQ68_08025 [Campylobacterales bacterium]|nr:hypothetical protein [Campylobacterales bacterium]